MEVSHEYHDRILGMCVSCNFITSHHTQKTVVGLQGPVYPRNDIKILLYINISLTFARNHANVCTNMTAKKNEMQIVHGLCESEKVIHL